MHSPLRKELNTLRALTSGCILVGSLLVLTALRGPAHPRFDEIDVERINIVERDGRVRMVIANLERTPGPIERGVPFAYGPGTRSGIIFYNEEGTENGGLVFGGKRDSTGKYVASGSLTFDQYEQDQNIALQYVDNNGQRRAGLGISDYAVGMSSAQLYRRATAARAIRDSASRADSLRVLRPYFYKERLYAGRNREGASVVTLSDATGRARLRLRVDSIGTAAIEFLNDSGRVIQRLPERR